MFILISINKHICDYYIKLSSELVWEGIKASIAVCLIGNLAQLLLDCNFFFFLKLTKKISKMVSLVVIAFKSPGTLNLFILYFPVHRILCIIYTEAQCLLHNWSGNESWSSSLLKNVCSDSSYPPLPCVEYTQGHILLTPKTFSFLIRNFCTRFWALQAHAVLFGVLDW